MASSRLSSFVLTVLVSACCLAALTVPRAAAAATTSSSSTTGSTNWEENVMRFCNAPTISNLRVKLISAKLSVQALALHNHLRCDDLARLAGRLADFKDDDHLPPLLRTTLTSYWQLVGANGDACTRQRQLNLAPASMMR
jgi:hypothetical protein